MISLISSTPFLASEESKFSLIQFSLSSILPVTERNFFTLSISSSVNPLLVNSFSTPSTPTLSSLSIETVRLVKSSSLPIHCANPERIFLLFSLITTPANFREVNTSSNMRTKSASFSKLSEPTTSASH